MKRTLSTLGLLVLVATAAGAQTAEQIVERLQSNQVYDTSRSTGVMTVTDRFGTKVTSFITYSRGADDTLIEFTSSEEKGQKILRTADEIYLFYPDARELIRLQGAAFRDSVMGSDVSYEDLTGGRTLLETYAVTLLGREAVDGADCFKVEMRARARNVAYPRQIIWVDTRLWAARRVEQYSLSGRLLKVVRMEDLRQVSGRTVPMRVLMQDQLKKDSSTILEVQSLEIGVTLDPRLFSLENLTW